MEKGLVNNTDITHVQPLSKVYQQLPNGKEKRLAQNWSECSKEERNLLSLPGIKLCFDKL
jgi:hypothetical protein